MGHQHHWCDEPPDGRIYLNKTFDERYGDEEDMAHNSYWTSPEELQRLRLLVEKDPGYEASPDWPMLVEWCTSCSFTRLVRFANFTYQYFVANLLTFWCTFDRSKKAVAHKEDNCIGIKHTSSLKNLQRFSCFDIWYLEVYFCLRLLCQREKTWQGLNPLTSNFFMRLPRKTQVEPAGRESDGTIDSPRKTQAEARGESYLGSQMVEFIHHTC